MPHVLFDEAHAEAWTIRPAVAAAMQPAHPADASYASAAAALRARDFTVAAHASGPLGGDALAAADVLVIAHPSDARYERTVPGGAPRLAPAELDAIEAFVVRGGGLIVLGETEQDKYGTNLDELLARFGLRIDHDTVQDYAHHRKAPSWILAELPEGARGPEGDVLARVRELCFYRASTVAATDLADRPRVLARTHASASTPHAPLALSAHHGAAAQWARSTHSAAWSSASRQSSPKRSESPSTTTRPAPWWALRASGACGVEALACVRARTRGRSARSVAATVEAR